MILINLLNSFDFFYQMSDDPRTFDKMRPIEKEINELIKDYTEEEILPHITDQWRKDQIKKRYFSA